MLRSLITLGPDSSLPSTSTAFAHAVAGAGATIVEDAPVRATVRDGDGYRLTTPRGAMSAAHVLLATNGKLLAGVIDSSPFAEINHPTRGTTAPMPGSCRWRCRGISSWTR